MRITKTAIYNSKLRFMTILLFGLFILTFCSGNMRSGLSYETHKLKDLTYYTDIRQWKVIPPPEDEALEVADSSKYYWKVYLDNGVPRAMNYPWEKIKIKNRPTFDTKLQEMRLRFSGYCFLEVSDGWLVGYSAGEWGGGLIWFSKDGKKHYDIKRYYKKPQKYHDRYSRYIFVPVRQFETVNEKIYAIAGYPRLLDYNGYILHLFKRKGKWAVQQILNMRYVPWAIFREKDGLLIVTTERLMRVSLETLKETLIYKGFYWGGLYPNSIIRLKNVFYIGMRQGVVKITVTKEKTSMEYLIPHPKVLKDDMKQ